MWPVLLLVAIRADRRETPLVPVELVTNAPTAALIVNGKRIGTKKVLDHRALFPAIRLREGPNLIRIEAIRSGRKLSDEAIWTLSPVSPRGVEAIPPAPEPGHSG